MEATAEHGDAILDDMFRGARSGGDQDGFIAAKPARGDIVGAVDQVGTDFQRFRLFRETPTVRTGSTADDQDDVGSFAQF